MKKISLIVFAVLFFAKLSFAQNLQNAYVKNGKVFVQYNNGTSKQIVSDGENSVIGFIRNKNIVIYQRIEQKSKTQGQEGLESFDQISVRVFNLTSDKEKILFTTCLDGNGGTRPDYASSSIYPNNNLCGFENALFSSDGERLYFQTEGWTTCPAIHYYNLKENKIVFYMAGWLQNVTDAGVEVQTTGIETKNNHGNIESNGRYTQYCLFDTNGDLIKELSAKEF